MLTIALQGRYLFLHPNFKNSHQTKQRQSCIAAVLFCFSSSWSPIGRNMHDQIRVRWIIGFQMYRIIMLAIHAWMHHEDTGFN